MPWTVDSQYYTWITPLPLTSPGSDSGDGWVSTARRCAPPQGTWRTPWRPPLTLALRPGSWSVTTSTALGWWSLVPDLTLNYSAAVSVTNIDQAWPLTLTQTSGNIISNQCNAIDGSYAHWRWIKQLYISIGWSRHIINITFIIYFVLQVHLLLTTILLNVLISMYLWSGLFSSISL